MREAGDARQPISVFLQRTSGSLLGVRSIGLLHKIAAFTASDVIKAEYLWLMEALRRR